MPCFCAMYIFSRAAAYIFCTWHTICAHFILGGARMRRGLCLFLFTGLFVLLAFSKAPVSPEATCDAVLSDMGLMRAGPFSKEEIILPRETDSTWRAYLALQTENGFPLAAYAGKTVWHLSCPIQNHPEGEGVYANFYLQDGQLLGGDILSPRLDGFLSPLPRTD